MGYHIHHTIVVNAWNRQALDRAHDEAVEIFEGIAPVSDIVVSRSNGYASFFVGPDGSKEGWEHSACGDSARRGFVNVLRSMRREHLWVEWVEVAFGGDEPAINTKIISHEGDDSATMEDTQ